MVRRRVLRRQQDHEGAHPHGAGPDGHPGSGRRSGPLSGAQLRAPYHDGRRNGQAGAGHTRGELPHKARHQGPPDALSPGADGADRDDEVHRVQPQAGRPELLHRRSLLPRLQHRRCADHEQELRAEGPRTFHVPQVIPLGGAPLPRRAGGPLRGPVPRRDGRTHGPFLRIAGRGRAHIPRGRDLGKRRARRKNFSP